MNHKPETPLTDALCATWREHGRRVPQMWKLSHERLEENNARLVAALRSMQAQAESYGEDSHIRRAITEARALLRELGEL